MNLQFLPLMLLSTTLLCFTGASFAKDNDSKDYDSKHKSEKYEKNKNHDKDDNNKVYFNADRKVIINNYYYARRDAKSCPPGLAKKNNGCKAPGKVKKWRKGQPLPSDVIYYDVQPELIVQLGRIPEGQKIVRVGADLLLISIGTGMVIDAIQDLNDIF
ncbi:MAG: hypothetical protein WBG74_03000 [Shewanella sp.]|uniref:hypothetical protein n=1 Tax=Shewanella sp. TaxID=50422 RepID=UPI003C7894B9